MADVKFSQFADGGELQPTDVIVGLRGGVNTQFDSPSSSGSDFLLKSNNLSDVDNSDSSFTNLGTGSGATLLLNDSDFSGGVYQLVNPCPNYIVLTCATPGNVLKLPEAQGLGSFSLGLGPIVKQDIGFQSVEIQDSAGGFIIDTNSPDNVQFILSSKATLAGLWDLQFNVTTVNGQSGDLILTSSLQTKYVSNSGSDADGDGSVLNPYATLSYAISQITDASSSKSYLIIVSGDISDTDWVIKPFISYDFTGSSLTLSGNMSLGTWGSDGSASILNLYNLILSNDAVLNFSVAGAFSPRFLINGLYIRSSNSLTITGSIVADPTTIIIYNFNSLSDLNLNNCNVYISNINVDSFNHINSSSLFCYINNLIVNFIYYFENTGLDLNLTSCNLPSGTFKANGPDPFNIYAEGNNFGLINFDAPSDLISLIGQTLTSVPVLSGGAVYTPTPIGNSVNANYVPVNYSALDESVSGNLAGIDNALGSSGSEDLQDTYNVGDNADINLTSGRPIKFINSSSTSSVNSITTQATGTNTVANYRVLGWTFIPAVNMQVTALQYDNIWFTSATTRETGIYNKNTQELLGSVFISQTDPLDSTTNFRTKQLDSPISLVSGTEYVFATVIPGGQSDFINNDAVGSNVSITGFAAGPASASPIPLQYPQSFTSAANAAYIGSFQYSTFTLLEEIDINDTSTGGNLLSVSSTTRATHPSPSMTSAQRLAIVSPTIGDIVFDTDQFAYYFYNGTSWTQIPRNLPSVPFQSITNSIPFPNTSLSNPAKAYYSIDFVTNGFIALWIANNILTVRPGYPIFFKNNSAFVATITDGSAVTICTMNPGDFYMIQLNSDATSDGTWIASNLGSAATVQTSNESSDTTCFPLFVTASGTQNLQPKNNSLWIYDSSTNTMNLAGLNLSGLTASEAVVTDGSKNLASLAYASANTASTLVQRDASGNFSAGAITVKNLIPTPVALTPGGGVNTDASLGNNFTLTLNTNTTLNNPTNLANGGTYSWIITQDSTPRTLAFANLFTFPGGVAPTVSTGSGAVDIITGYYDGTKLRCVYSQAFA